MKPTAPANSDDDPGTCRLESTYTTRLAGLTVLLLCNLTCCGTLNNYQDGVYKLHAVTPVMFSVKEVR